MVTISADAVKVDMKNVDISVPGAAGVSGGAGQKLFVIKQPFGIKPEKGMSRTMEFWEGAVTIQEEGKNCCGCCVKSNSEVIPRTGLLDFNVASNYPCACCVDSEFCAIHTLLLTKSLKEGSNIGEENRHLLLPNLADVSVDQLQQYIFGGLGKNGDNLQLIATMVEAGVMKKPRVMMGGPEKQKMEREQQSVTPTWEMDSKVGGLYTKASFRDSGVLVDTKKYPRCCCINNSCVMTREKRFIPRVAIRGYGTKYSTTCCCCRSVELELYVANGNTDGSMDCEFCNPRKPLTWGCLGLCRIGVSALVSSSAPSASVDVLALPCKKDDVNTGNLMQYVYGDLAGPKGAQFAAAALSRRYQLTNQVEHKTTLAEAF